MACRWPTGLIRSGAAKRVLLITAETYSKYIHPTDRSLRTIFGDAAAATLVEAADEPTLSAFQFGTDGTGADTLLVTKGAPARPKDAIRPRHRQRWESALYMDGPSLINFTVVAVPAARREHPGSRRAQAGRRRPLPAAPGDAEDAGPAARADEAGRRADADLPWNTAATRSPRRFRS